MPVLTQTRLFLLFAVLYLIGSLVHGPRQPEEMEGIAHLRIGPFVISRPMVLSGDSPHYLTAVQSLVLDRDFDLRNNYDRALQGGWDSGARFRGVELDRHVDADEKGRQLPTHAPLFSFLVAIFVWPLAGSPWVESASVLLTMAVALLGLRGAWEVFERTHPAENRGETMVRVSLLALGTSVFCYSRDLWTEPWILTIWIGLLLFSHPVASFVLGFLGSVIKYPFALVPFTMGVVHFFKGNRLLGFILAASSGAGLFTAFLVTQYLFQDVSHFSLFHVGTHSGTSRRPLIGLVGTFFHPSDGLLPFFPFLAWGVWSFRRGGPLYLPAIVYFVVHALYAGWGGGTGFSSRYLVPMFPLLITGISLPRQGRLGLFYMAAAYGLFWGIFGGFFPALVFDRAPWEVFQHIYLSMGLSDLP